MFDAMDHYQLARQLYEAGDYRTALLELESLLADEPVGRDVLELAGLAYFKSAQLGRAEATFSRLIERDPSDAYAHFALGRTLERQSRKREAKSCYQLAVVMDPTPDYRLALDRLSA